MATNDEASGAGGGSGRKGNVLSNDGAAQYVGHSSFHFSLSTWSRQVRALGDSPIRLAWKARVDSLRSMIEAFDILKSMADME